MKESILKRWSSAENYLGEDFSEYFIVTSFNRDSNVYEVSNFLAIARHLSAIESESDSGWKIVRFSHWMCGYFYSILVHENSPLVPECEAIVIAMKEYPIYNEDVLSECKSQIEEKLSEIEDTETRIEMLFDAPAALLCESLLKPYL